MLGVHVIGPGFGESIVIELPTGEVGVIDSFVARHTDPPVLNFLREQFPSLARLKFVALTHPHADHCMGVSCFFEKYVVEEFWVFHSFIQHACMGFFKSMFDKGTADTVEKDLDLPGGSTFLQALKLRKAVKKRGDQLTKRFLIANHESEVCKGVRVKFLTPNHAGQWRYSESLGKALQKLVQDGPSLSPEWDPGRLPHNQACGAILFEHGETRVLLMADAEDDLWQDLIDTQELPLPTVNFIKAAHHGSINGYHSEIYKLVADKGTIIVLTPFNRHEHPLPTQEGLECLKRHSSDVLCTNAVAARASSRLDWRPIKTNASPPLPLEWAATCRANPALLSLLEDQQKGHPYTAGAVRIPRKWLHDCQAQPRLIQLLCAELRNNHVVAPRDCLTDEFRVSIFYDDKGKEQRRDIGWGVGQLS